MSEAERGIRTTVAVIDDGDDLAGALRGAPELDVVAHVAPDAGLIDALWKTVPDAVVLTADTPGVDVVPLCRELSETLPICRILLVSDDGDAPFDAVTAGAAAVVSRDTLSAAPAPIVRQVARGEAIASQRWAAQALDAFEQPGAPRLTATEREVLQRLAKGASSETIAGLHEVPPRLVRLHAGYALAKLHLAERDRRIDAGAT